MKNFDPRPAVHDSFKDDEQSIHIIKEVTVNAFRIDFKGTQAWFMFDACEINSDGFWIVKSSIKN